jgi:hypothetical protein
MSNVLVIFQSDTEPTEQMALAVAVGAVEAQASIRLRRLAAPGAPDVGHKGYGKLQQRDLLWANTVVVGLESPTPRAEDLEDLLSLLSAADPAQLSGRLAWTFGPDGPLEVQTKAQIAVELSLQVAGFELVPPSALAADEGTTEKMKEAGRLSSGLTSAK